MSRKDKTDDQTIYPIQLNKVLWDAADSSRWSVDAGIYKDYALTMLFFKYLSDKSKAEHAKSRRTLWRWRGSYWR